MQPKHDPFITIHNCENAVHDAFKKHSGDPQSLSSALGSLHTEYGREVVMITMANCMEIAYIRLYGAEN